MIKNQNIKIYLEYKHSNFTPFFNALSIYDTKVKLRKQ